MESGVVPATGSDGFLSSAALEQILTFQNGCEAFQVLCC